MGKTRIVNSWSGECIWDEGKLNYVKKVLNYKDYFITYKTESGQSKLFNDTVEKKDKFTIQDVEGHGVFSMKKDKPFTKYGGLISAKVAYGFAIEYINEKGKTVRVVETIPMILYFANDEEIKEYLSVECNCSKEKIKLIKKIWKNQLIIVKDSLLTMASPSEWNIRRQLFIPENLKKTAYCIEKKYINDLDDNKLLELFEFVLKTTAKNVPVMESQCKAVLAEKENFENLSIENKAEKLSQIIAGCSSGKACKDIKFDKKLIKSAFGRLNEKKTNLDNTTFVFQSVTGIYCKKVKL